ncbi:Gfo/Idh/MocA family protein [Cyclobacterium amurskyense]|jgi:predicted dehydrogenase|uniref:Oxidoreductase domain protein n=1 Tax=Cyclobacterium amurskyense TaxID=320787 RepID=A0A0H4PK67_9BACT|nr:Gfo/Idh/MocA family oxidoreductase [Cyclobacterium amurskyense]AKP53378.1 Oxidoreductase domain protein [Cyclobacterium amurskyense]|tara:strand:+ start:2386 stop:3795 length:1410 start_codon:yes stop_codon:yes gene_type:complete
MSNKRREFLKLSGLAGLGVVGTGFKGLSLEEQEQVLAQSKKQHTQRFNMSGYAAPKLDVVRVGVVGLGNRGPGAVNRLSKIEGVEIKALCDLRPEMVDKVMKSLEGTKHKPETYSGSAYAWKKMVDRDDLDLIYIVTPWEWHTPMAVYAMEAGKHACSEVPIAVTVEECWQLVETSERTKKHCMMMENCCYDFFELMTLNMARDGFFGDVFHGEGAYIHDLLGLNFQKEGYQDMWRLKENFRNGSLYPTHGLGPVCQAMDINRGDQMDYLTSLSSNDFLMKANAQKLAETDSFYSSFATKNFRGNMNTTIIKTKKGKSIMVQHDVSSPRPYSRIHLLSGTKGAASKYPVPGISTGHEGWFKADEMKALEERYTPEIVKKVGEMAKQIGGHGGMDFMMDWRMIDCLRNGLPYDQDVYDGALWSAIAPLSEWSVANRSNSIDVPDFTGGSWKTNAPVNLTLEGGGTTGVHV